MRALNNPLLAKMDALSYLNLNIWAFLWQHASYWAFGYSDPLYACFAPISLEIN